MHKKYIHNHSDELITWINKTNCIILVSQIYYTWNALQSETELKSGQFTTEQNKLFYFVFL